MFDVKALMFSPRATNKQWYKTNTYARDTGEKIASLDIYDAIDPFWGVSAQEVVGYIKALEVDKIYVSINSPGGDFFDGMAIANSLRSHSAKVVATIDGVAASIAAVIFAAADERYMHETAHAMIHKAWSHSVGNATELRELATILDRLDGSLVQVFDRVLDRSPEEIETMLEAETWFTAAEAREVGFAEVVESPEVQARQGFDLSCYTRVPEALRETTEKARAQAAAKAAAPAETFVTPQRREALLARLKAMGVDRAA